MKAVPAHLPKFTLSPPEVELEEDALLLPALELLLLLPASTSGSKISSPSSAMRNLVPPRYT